MQEDNALAVGIDCVAGLAPSQPQGPIGRTDKGDLPRVRIMVLGGATVSEMNGANMGLAGSVLQGVLTVTKVLMWHFILSI